MSKKQGGLLRDRVAGKANVTSIELFFDLVYVLAITQLSNLLQRDLSWTGAGKTLLLLLAVWWAWNYTSWVTNYFDPEKVPVRLLLVVLMLASLVMSGSLPMAFQEHGWLFAAAYVFIQVARTLFAVIALQRGHPLRDVFLRALLWWSATGVMWLAGGALDGAARVWVWSAAMALDVTGVMAGFPVPGLGRSLASDYTIDGGHLAERCQTFVILALGESIVVTGAHFSEALNAPWTATACVITFLASVALWWAYFDVGAEAGQRAIRASSDPGQYGVWTFTYFHVPIVAGIVVTAAAAERTIAHPAEPATMAATALCLGGPALYLLGTALYSWSIDRKVPLPRVAALSMLLALTCLSPVLTVLGLTSAATVVILLVAAWDKLAHVYD